MFDLGREKEGIAHWGSLRHQKIWQWKETEIWQRAKPEENILSVQRKGFSTQKQKPSAKTAAEFLEIALTLFERAPKTAEGTFIHTRVSMLSIYIFLLAWIGPIIESVANCIHLLATTVRYSGGLSSASIWRYFLYTASRHGQLCGWTSEEFISQTLGHQKVLRLL